MKTMMALICWLSLASLASAQSAELHVYGIHAPNQTTRPWAGEAGNFGGLGVAALGGKKDSRYFGVEWNRFFGFGQARELRSSNLDRPPGRHLLRRLVSLAGLA